MSDYVVREGVLDDYESWRSVYHEVASEGMWIGGEQAPAHELMRPRFQTDVEDPERLLLVAESQQDGIVGGLSAAPTVRGVAHFGMQLVSRWRGQGVGAALLERCIDWCREREFHKVVLEVWPHNTRAIALYEKFGFEREGRLHRHYRRSNGQLWDAVAMGLVLDHDSPGSPHPDQGAA